MLELLVRGNGVSNHFYDPQELVIKYRRRFYLAHKHIEPSLPSLSDAEGDELIELHNFFINRERITGQKFESYIMSNYSDGSRNFLSIVMDLYRDDNYQRPNFTFYRGQSIVNMLSLVDNPTRSRSPERVEFTYHYDPEDKSYYSVSNPNYNGYNQNDTSNQNGQGNNNTNQSGQSYNFNFTNNQSQNYTPNQRVLDPSAEGYITTNIIEEVLVKLLKIVEIVLDFIYK